MSECNLCNGTGWFKQANYQHEVMEWVECLDCLAEQKQRKDMVAEAAKIISQTSHERLCKLLATFCTEKMEPKRLALMLDNKDYVSLMSFIEVNLK
ncbi:MAG: hypothetical protein CM15mV62_830 [uncultured marine virus]|nr:MAG: hypothetical protein CM15mV62_830 [uncultured marine virus]